MEKDTNKKIVPLEDIQQNESGELEIDLEQFGIDTENLEDGTEFEIEEVFIDEDGNEIDASVDNFDEEEGEVIYEISGDDIQYDENGDIVIDFESLGIDLDSLGIEEEEEQNNDFKWLGGTNNG